jgi:hypothetical protein
MEGTDGQKAENKVKVAIGGSVKGFRNLQVGARYYLADSAWEAKMLAQDEHSASSTDALLTSLMPQEPKDYGEMAQVMGIAKSEHEILIMPSLDYRVIKDMGAMPAADNGGENYNPPAENSGATGDSGVNIGNPPADGSGENQGDDNVGSDNGGQTASSTDETVTENDGAGQTGDNADNTNNNNGQSSTDDNGSAGSDEQMNQPSATDESAGSETNVDDAGGQTDNQPSISGSTENSGHGEQTTNGNDNTDGGDQTAQSETADAGSETSGGE